MTVLLGREAPLPLADASSCKDCIALTAEELAEYDRRKAEEVNDAAPSGSSASSVAAAQATSLSNLILLFLKGVSLTFRIFLEWFTSKPYF